MKNVLKINCCWGQPVLHLTAAWVGIYGMLCGLGNLNTLTFSLNALCVSVVMHTSHNKMDTGEAKYT